MATNAIPETIVFTEKKHFPLDGKNIGYLKNDIPLILMIPNGI
jgi:hypothetical protein